MSGHTPGPWHIVTADMLDLSDALDNDLDPSAIVIANPYAETPSASVVADVWMLGDERQDEQQANARLIAAAPELLAALKALLKWHAEEYQSNPIIDAEARAAIAKAEGRDV